MPPPERRDPNRAFVFGIDAERYHRARPSYPAALIDDLVQLGGRRVLDVGCGTGKAGALFVARGCEVLGVEPDERMAAIARRSGLPVEIDTFERWDPAGRTFELVVSGQAWHWVDPRIGPAKAAGVLVPGGSLAVFRNRPGHEPFIRTRLDEVYRRVVPDLARDSTVFGREGVSRTDEMIGAIDRSRRFEPATIRVYPWDATYTTEQYLDGLQTHSDHLLLASATLGRLLEGIRDVLDANGGCITIDFETTLICARRTG